MDVKRLELIKKLIKLANNNPNEHEANLAARKVCSMLTDYKFTQSTSSERVRSASNPTYNPFEELFKRARQQAQQGPRTWDDVNRSTEPWWKSTYQAQPREKINRKCSICNKSIPTLSVDNPYVCADCQPEKARREREAKKEYNIQCCECGKESKVSKDYGMYFVCDACLTKRYGKDGYVRSDIP